MRCARALPIHPLMPAAGSLGVPVATSLLGGLPGKIERPHPFGSPVHKAASSLLLPRAVGHLGAAQLLLAEPIAAEHAHQLGLVTEVVQAGNHLARAHQIAATLARQPTRALRLTKQLLRATEGSVLRRLREEIAVVRLQLAGPEFASAGAAFTQRRPETPRWSNSRYATEQGPARSPTDSPKPSTRET